MIYKIIYEAQVDDLQIISNVFIMLYEHLIMLQFILVQGIIKH